MPRNKTSAQRFGGSSSLMKRSRCQSVEPPRRCSVLVDDTLADSSIRGISAGTQRGLGRRGVSDRDRCLRYRAPELRVVAEKEASPAPFQRLQSVKRGQHRLALVHVTRQKAQRVVSGRSYAKRLAGLGPRSRSLTFLRSNAEFKAEART